jgi:hypothetical protein
MADPRPVDPSVQLLVDEIRRGQDSMRADLVGEQKNTTAAINDLVSEMRALRAMAPGKGNVYLASAIIMLALLSMLGLMSVKGVNVTEVAHAASEVAPGFPAP